MKSPKKRKIPKSQRSQYLKRQANISMNLQSLPIMKAAAQTTLDVLATPMDLEMEYSIEQSHKMMNAFLEKHDLKHVRNAFIPESVICKAHNYGELIIALKFQQVVCTEWTIEATGTFFNTVSEEFEDVDYKINLKDASYIEVFMGMPIKIDRGAGIKTRWRGLEDELKRHFDEKGFTAENNWYRGNTNVKFVGKCYFNNINFYEEFMHLREIIEKGNIEKFFETLDQDSIEKGRVDEKMQPKNSEALSIPDNLVSYFKKNFSMQDFGKKLSEAA